MDLRSKFRETTPSKITQKSSLYSFMSVVSLILDNPLSLSLVVDDHIHSLGFELINDMHEVVETCNGLVCLFGERNNYEVAMFLVWNPITRRIFEDLQCILALPGIDDAVRTFGFGYDVFHALLRI
ncbi:hypothetical protein HKD37_18G051613 [Glycine soja]